MQYPCPLIALFAATAVLAIPVPLNINMGAYSPALVVGDGAIGFKGGESVNQIMNTLQGAAASGAAANGAANAATVAAATAPTTQGVQQAGSIQQAGVISEPTPEIITTQNELPQGMGKKVVTTREEAVEHVEDKRMTAEEDVEINEDVEEEDAEKRDVE